MTGVSTLNGFLRARRGLLFICLLILVGLCTSIPVAAQSTSLPFRTPVNPKQLPETALVETTRGAFEIAFYRDAAPISSRNFQHLAEKKFYENVAFHRHEPGFVIQGGDPSGSGKGGPGYTLPPEFSELRHERGTLGLARLPSEVNPERRSNGSQFYICLQPSPHLDGLYTVFAKVVNGMETVEKLRKGDKILRIAFPKRKAPTP